MINNVWKMPSLAFTKQVFSFKSNDTYKLGIKTPVFYANYGLFMTRSLKQRSSQTDLIV